MQGETMAQLVRIQPREVAKVSVGGSLTGIVVVLPITRDVRAAAWAEAVDEYLTGSQSYIRQLTARSTHEYRP
jgi:hypothetical protein